MSTNSHSWTDYYAWWSKSHVIFSSKAYDWANWANNSNISHCCFTVRRYRRKYSTLGHCVCFGCCVMKRKKQNCIGCRGLYSQDDDPVVSKKIRCHFLLVLVFAYGKYIVISGLNEKNCSSSWMLPSAFVAEWGPQHSIHTKTHKLEMKSNSTETITILQS